MLDTNHPGNETWTFMGPDGASTTTAPIEPYLMQRYKGVDTGYGMPSINWMSPSRAYPRLPAQSPAVPADRRATGLSDRNSHIDNNENIKETVQAAYVQADTRLFNSRLRILGGVRFERTIDKGIGGLVDSRSASGSATPTAPSCATPPASACAGPRPGPPIRSPRAC
jgi:hypothetical protein